MQFGSADGKAAAAASRQLQRNDPYRPNPSSASRKP
jgi:hypothetical protein